MRRKRAIVSMHDLWLPTWGPEVGLSESPSRKPPGHIYKKVDPGADRQLLLENLNVDFKFTLAYPELFGVPITEVEADFRPVMVEVGNVRGNVVSEHREWMRVNRSRSTLAFFPEVEDCRSIQPTRLELLDATHVLMLDGLMPMTLSSFAGVIQSGKMSSFPKLEPGDEAFFPFVLERDVGLDQTLIMSAGEGTEPEFSLANAIESVQFFRGNTRLFVPCWQYMAA